MAVMARTDDELVESLATSAADAIRTMHRSIVADRPLLKTVNLELSIDGKGNVTLVDSFISRRIPTNRYLGLRG